MKAIIKANLQKMKKNVNCVNLKIKEIKHSKKER